jgi:hypothetical protein
MCCRWLKGQRRRVLAFRGCLVRAWQRNVRRARHLALRLPGSWSVRALRVLRGPLRDRWIRHPLVGQVRYSDEERSGRVLWLSALPLHRLIHGIARASSWMLFVCRELECVRCLGLLCGRGRSGCFRSRGNLRLVILLFGRGLLVVVRPAFV